VNRFQVLGVDQREALCSIRDSEREAQPGDWNYCIVPGCSCQNGTQRVFTREFIEANIELVIRILDHEIGRV
jgi:hypothetical protein